jgi:hypothetical protein
MADQVVARAPRFMTVFQLRPVPARRASFDEGVRHARPADTVRKDDVSVSAFGANDLEATDGDLQRLHGFDFRRVLQQHDHEVAGRKKADPFPSDRPLKT